MNVLEDTQSVVQEAEISPDNNRQSFREQFLQRKAMFEAEKFGKAVFEAQGKRHSIDLLEERSDAELYQLESRPKSCGDTMETFPLVSPLECNQ